MKESVGLEFDQEKGKIVETVNEILKVFDRYDKVPLAFVISSLTAALHGVIDNSVPDKHKAEAFDGAINVFNSMKKYYEHKVNLNE